MVKIIIRNAQGNEALIQAEPGDNLMNAAISNGIDGIIGECGGSMMCATCHCYVDEDWLEKTGDRIDGEDDMLECAAAEIKPNSRLSCQILVSNELDGLIVHLPDRQI